MINGESVTKISHPWSQILLVYMVGGEERESLLKINVLDVVYGQSCPSVSDL